MIFFDLPAGAQTAGSMLVSGRGGLSVAFN